MPVSTDGKYFILKRCKDELDIPDSDEVDDAYLVARGVEQDVVVDNDLAGFLELIPVGDAQITLDLCLASVYGVAQRYKLTNKGFELADKYAKLYLQTIESIKTRLKSIPTTHTKRVSVTKSYRTEPQSSDA